MSRLKQMFATAVSMMLLATPVLAQQIQGAGSGSTGGTMEGKTNENKTMTKMGADNGTQVVPSANPQGGAGTGDNAVLNAGGEKPPGSTGTSLPSSLNGQSQ